MGGAGGITGRTETALPSRDALPPWFCKFETLVSISHALDYFAARRRMFCVLRLSTVSAAPPKEPIASDAAPSQPPEDHPQPLVPKKPRTEAEENRVQAEALLATARTMEQRQESAAALRLYERAFRLDPQAVAALEEIVPLAFSLNRRDESLRYAVKLAEQDTSDPDLPRRIGMYLAENGDWKPAIKLLQRSVKVMETAGKPAAERIAVEAELARLDFLAQKYTDSAALLDKVAAALAKPKDFGLDETARRTLIGEGGLTYELMGDAYLEVGRTADAAKAFHSLNDLAPKARHAGIEPGPSRIQVKTFGRGARQAANLFGLASGRPESRGARTCSPTC